MFNCSRRDFMKSAGAAVLAVAAAGMLAGCGANGPEMVDVHVSYVRESFLGGMVPIDDHEKYDEVVSVAMGSKLKKSELKNLVAACSGSTTYPAKDVPEEIEVDWKTATAQVVLTAV